MATSHCERRVEQTRGNAATVYLLAFADGAQQAGIRH
jgi:hypothetical protein